MKSIKATLTLEKFPTSQFGDREIPWEKAIEAMQSRLFSFAYSENDPHNLFWRVKNTSIKVEIIE